MIRVDPLARSLTPNELGVAVDPPRCLKPGPCEQVAHGEVSLSSAADDGGPGARPLQVLELEAIDLAITAERAKLAFALAQGDALAEDAAAERLAQLQAYRELAIEVPA